MSGMGDRKLDKKNNKPTRRYNEISAGSLSWADVDVESVRDLVVAVTATGGAVRFGLSRDKGAYAIGILGDGDPYTVWAASTDELDIKITALIQAFSK